MYNMAMVFKLQTVQNFIRAKIAVMFISFDHKKTPCLFKVQIPGQGLACAKILPPFYENIDSICKRFDQIVLSLSWTFQACTHR